MPNGPLQAKFTEVGCPSPLPEFSKENYNDEPPPDIYVLWATAFDHLTAIKEVVEALAI